MYFGDSIQKLFGYATRQAFTYREWTGTNIHLVKAGRLTILCVQVNFATDISFE